MKVHSASYLKKDNDNGMKVFYYSQKTHYGSAIHPRNLVIAAGRKTIIVNREIKTKANKKQLSYTSYIGK